MQADLPQLPVPACLGQHVKEEELPVTPSSGLSEKPSADLGCTLSRPSTAHTVQQLSLCYFPDTCGDNAVVGENYLSLLAVYKLRKDDCTDISTPFCIYENNMCSTHDIPLSCVKTRSKKWRQIKNGLHRYVSCLMRKWICPSRFNSQKITKPFQTVSGEIKREESQAAQISRKLFLKRRRD